MKTLKVKIEGEYLMENKNQKPKRFSVTWTKNITRILLIIGVIGGMTSFIWSVLDKDPCSEMGIAWVTEIVAVALGYFVRGFKDTKESEKVRLLERRIEYSEELKG